MYLLLLVISRTKILVRGNTSNAQQIPYTPCFSNMSLNYKNKSIHHTKQ